MSNITCEVSNTVSGSHVNHATFLGEVFHCHGCSHLYAIPKEQTFTHDVSKDVKGLEWEMVSHILGLHCEMRVVMNILVSSLLLPLLAESFYTMMSRHRFRVNLHASTGSLGQCGERDEIITPVRQNSHSSESRVTPLHWTQSELKSQQWGLGYLSCCVHMRI